MRDPDLWARLESFSFDGAGSAPYSVKLAKAERWDAQFTRRVIEEYRRFLYLTQVSPRQVTPSRTVDAAWHMHLTFTRDYWEDLCPNVIGAPVHHQPCAGEEEMPRYRDQFAATRALYEAEFLHEPPSDIWGDTSANRFVHGLASAEGGAVAITPSLLIFIAVAACAGLYVAGFELHWMVYGAIIFSTYLLGLVLERPAQRRRGKTRRQEDGSFDFEYEGENSDSERRNTDGGEDSDNKTSTGSGKGFWATLFDRDGGSDSSGCGGCGGD